MIRHQFGQVEYASEHWFRLAATTLATLTRAAGLATPAKPVSAHLRHLDLVAISDRMASLILVLREGALRQILCNLDEPVDQDGLSLIAGRLNELLAGRTAGQAEAALDRLPADDPASELPRRLGERVVRALHEFDDAATEELFSDGLLNVMAAPEFAQSEKLRRVFAALEDRAYLAHLIGGVALSGTIRVYIGSENPAEEMADVSLVLAPYGQPGRAVGVIGVLGPTRMAYPQAIGTVRFVSGLMNELVDHLYA
jgi:heat-inducible transcriptional repressor